MVYVSRIITLNIVKTRTLSLLSMLALTFGVAACVPEPPPTAASLPSITPLPVTATDTIAPVSPTAVGTEVTGSTVLVTESATADVIDDLTLDATQVATDVVSTEQATVESSIPQSFTAEPTLELTIEVTAAILDSTPESTEVIGGAVTLEVTLESTAEAIIESTQAAAVEVTVEPTADPTTDPTAVATILEVTSIAIPAESQTPTLQIPTIETTLEATVEVTLEVTSEPTLANTPIPAATTSIPSPSIPDLSDAPRPTTSVIIHVVTANETLYDIARRYGITIEQITAANIIYNPNNLLVGTRLIIPIRVILPPTATPTITATPGPTNTPGPTETPVEDFGIITPSVRPVLFEGGQLPNTLNGVPIGSIISIDGGTRDHIRQMFACGLKHQGRNPNGFSKMGDCNSVAPYFLGRFDKVDGGEYNLGDYVALQDEINHYAGSFGRYSVATDVGLHSWSVFDSAWANKQVCNAGENVIDCEIRIHNPSLMFVALGTNDAGAPSLFEKNMRRIVEASLAHGVIPILVTKSDRLERSNKLNDIVRGLAREFRVPLWDHDKLSSTLPNRGLDGDYIHMTMFPSHDYTLPQALQRGHGAQNIAALYVLREVRGVLSGVTAADCPN